MYFLQMRIGESPVKNTISTLASIVSAVLAQIGGIVKQMLSISIILQRLELQNLAESLVSQ